MAASCESSKTTGSLPRVSSRRSARDDARDLRKLSVLMPVFNERFTLGEICRRVLDSAVPLKIELIVVDDASTDGSWEVLEQLAQQEPRIRCFRQQANQGKGAAVQRAIAEMTGDVAIVQDADLEYDPDDYPLLLEPILEGRADAVFGSRFAGHSRRVLFFWHSMANYLLTLLSNMLNNLNLTDMETCYKMVRADVLKGLRLNSNTFTFEPELTCRLAQWGARIYEVPISYHGRTYDEGKKIGPLDGLKALWAMIRYRLFDTQFTHHAGFFTLASMSRATGYNRWILQQVEPFLGPRLLEAGSGIGNLSRLLLNRERLVLVDHDEVYSDILKARYGQRLNVRVDHASLTDSDAHQRWQDERIDTILCSNVLEHIEPDLQVLHDFNRTLVPGGHCVIVVPAGPWLYTGIDRKLGHVRRYTRRELHAKMEEAGFEVAFSRRFSKLGSICWAVSGHLLRRRQLSPTQMRWFDRILPLAKAAEHVLPVAGMSLIVVGRKPARSATRRAA